MSCERTLFSVLVYVRSKVLSQRYNTIWHNSRQSNLPKHLVDGSPEKPGGHSQVKLPGVLVQIAFSPHLLERP